VSIGVPDVVGLDQESAIHALREAGFLANVSLRSSRQLAGLVTGQSPRAGQRPPQGAIVFLTVSTGPTTTVAASRSHAPGRAGLTRT
jgi:beta-lactam-binding protein with PASTA domain